MDKLRESFEKLTKKQAPENMSKVMLEKYVTWFEQVNKESSLTLDKTNMSSVSHSRISLKELQALLKGNLTINVVKSGTKLVREYQGKKYEVSIIDGNSKHPNGCFFYMGKQYKSLSKIAREITGTNWNGKLFFRVTPKGASLGTK